MATSSAAERDDAAPQQSTLTMSSEPINLQLVLLIFILTWSSWYPYMKQVNFFSLAIPCQSNCPGQTITLAYELASQKLLIV